MITSNKLNRFHNAINSISSFIRSLYYLDSRISLKDIFYFSCLLILCVTTIYIGAAPTHLFGHDIFFLLDNSWRVIHDLRPHVDYTSAWGPLTFVIFAFGLKLAKFTANGIGYGNAVFGLLIGLWSYYLCRNRLYYFARLLFSLFMVGLVVAPYALSFEILATTHAMVYNRYGYALLGLILLECLQPVQDQNLKAADFLGGISTGIAIALTFFLKISYFFAAILLTGGILLIRMRLTRYKFCGFTLGFSLTTIAFLAYLNFDVQAIFHDLQMAAGARSESLQHNQLLKKFNLNAIYFPLIVLFGLSSIFAMGSKQIHWEDIKLPLIGALVFLTDLFLIFTNQQRFELPLIATFVLIVFNNLTAHFRNKHNKIFPIYNISYFVLLLIGSSIFLPIFVSQYVALSNAAIEKKNPPHIESVTRFKQPILTDLLLYEGDQPSSNGHQYTTYINEGVALLLAVSKQNETVQTIDMFNPFPFALGRKPPSGGIAAAAYNYTFSDKHRPSDDMYFGNADIVMVPKKPAADGDYHLGIIKIYGPALKDSFSLVAETDWWYLYRRKK